MKLKDSGKRRLFDTGAARDIAEGKGRCDLLPLVTISAITQDKILQCIGEYIYIGDKSSITAALLFFVTQRYKNVYDALLEVSKQYEDGANKYLPRNWERGIPLHCYVDSGVRHYLKFMRGDTDEPHDRAFVWNMLGLLWTQENLPKMNDLPFGETRECADDSSDKAGE